MELKNLPIEKITPNPFQPREGFDKKSIKELANSFKSRGEIQPIIAREKDDGYQIICGERRWRAADYAGLSEIPVLVRDTAEEDVLLESLIENLHRQDLESHERENAVYELWESGRWNTQEQLGEELGKSQDWISSNVRAARKRREEKIPTTISTRTIGDLSGIEKGERKIIINRIEEGEIPAEKAREYRTAVRTLPEPVKKRVIKSESRLTPRVGKKVAELPENIRESTMDRIESRRLDEEEAISEIEKTKAEVEMIPKIGGEIKAEAMRERYEELKQDIDRILEKPEVQERGRWFRNWYAHYVMAGALENAFCPDHPDDSGKLVWDCCGKSLKKAKDEAGAQFESRQEED